MMTTLEGIKGGKISKLVYGMGFNKITAIHKIIRVSRIIDDHDDYDYDYDYKDGDDENDDDKVRRVAEVLVLGTSLWREIPYVLPYWNLHCMNNVCAHGDMHWLCSGFKGKGVEHASYFRLTSQKKSST
ncbi:hypothetical protein ACLB2K_002579 [Fragaria x ananassa]